MYVLDSKRSLLTSCIFNELYFHESEEQISFSVGNNPEARSGQADSRTPMKRSVMSPEKNLQQATFF